jgi:hydroxyacylglutathione hydrolase
MVFLILIGALVFGPFLALSGLPGKIAEWLAALDMPRYGDPNAPAALAVRELAMIGLDHAAAWYDLSVVAEWKASGKTLGTIAKIDSAAAAPRIAQREVTVLDVRNRTEYEAGHLPGSLHIPVGHLTARLAEIPRDKPIIVQCQAGARSAIATSVLQRLGVTNATDLLGGFAAWEQGGHPVEREGATVGV